MGNLKMGSDREGNFLFGSAREPRLGIARAACSALLGAALAFGPVTSAMAMPAYPGNVTISQPDGTAVTATPHGDETFHFTTNGAGAVILQDRTDGTWYQVVRSGDGLAFGPKASEATAEGAITDDDLNDSATRNAFIELSGSGWLQHGTSTPDVVTLADIQASQGVSEAGTMSLARSGAATATTSEPLAIIVAEFSDEPYREDYDWHETFFSSEYSVSSLYSISSEGKFTWVPAEESSANGVAGNHSPQDVEDDGIIHITINHSYGDLDPWGWDYDNGVPTQSYYDYEDTMREIFTEAAKYIDFKSYDTDGDGIVSRSELGVGVVFAGYEGATSCIPAGHHGIWSHAGSFLESDGAAFTVTNAAGEEVGVDPYIVQSESESMQEGEEHQAGIGALGHELGHFLGLPDYYAAYNYYGTWENYSSSYLTIMDAGSWGRTVDGTYRPTYFDPYSRALLGYIEPISITEDATNWVYSEDDANGYNCYRVDVSDDEYYLIENRQYEGFDTGMEPLYKNGVNSNDEWVNPTGGIVVWHIVDSIVNDYDLTPSDPNNYNRINDPDHRPGMMENYWTYDNPGRTNPIIWMPFLTNATQQMSGLGLSNLITYDGSDDPNVYNETGITVSTPDLGASAMRLTVDFPAEVTGITPEQSELESTGGAVDFGITLENAGENDTVKLNIYKGDELVDTVDASAPSARAMGSSATAEFAENTGTADENYDVRVVLNDEELDEPAATVTVKAAKASTDDPTTDPNADDPTTDPNTGDKPTTGSQASAGQAAGNQDGANGSTTGKPSGSKAPAGKVSHGGIPKTGDAGMAAAAAVAVAGAAALASARAFRRNDSN